MGGLVAGQSFDTGLALSATLEGDIFGGRLRVPMSVIELPIDAGRLLPQLLRNGELRVDLSPSGATNGVLAGSYPVDVYVPQVGAVMPGIEPTVRSVLESVADRVPRAADPAVCGELSVGMSFTGVPATRLP